MNTKLVKNLKTEGISWEGGLELLDACVDDIGYARYLLNQGNRNFNWKETESGVSILHTLSYTDSVQALKLLVEFGADVNIRNKNDETPLHWCAKLNSKDCAKILIDHGCDATIVDISGSTPLHCAAAAGHVEVIPLMLDVPQAVQLVQMLDNSGMTALDLSSNGKSPSYFAISVLLLRFYQQHHITPPSCAKDKVRNSFHLEAHSDDPYHSQHSEVKLHQQQQRQQQREYEQQPLHNGLHNSADHIIHGQQQEIAAASSPKYSHHDRAQSPPLFFAARHIAAVPVTSTHGGLGEDVTGVSSMDVVITPPHSPRSPTGAHSIQHQHSHPRSLHPFLNLSVVTNGAHGAAHASAPDGATGAQQGEAKSPSASPKSPRPPFRPSSLNPDVSSQPTPKSPRPPFRPSSLNPDVSSQPTPKSPRSPQQSPRAWGAPNNLYHNVETGNNDSTVREVSPTVRSRKSGKSSVASAASSSPLSPSHRNPQSPKQQSSKQQSPKQQSPKQQSRDAATTQSDETGMVKPSSSKEADFNALVKRVSIRSGVIDSSSSVIGAASGVPKRRKSLAHIDSQRGFGLEHFLRQDGDDDDEGGDGQGNGNRNIRGSSDKLGSGSGSGKWHKDDTSPVHRTDAKQLTFGNRQSVRELFRDSSNKFETFIGHAKYNKSFLGNGNQNYYSSRYYIHRSFAQSMFPLAEKLPLLPAIQPDPDNGVTKVHSQYLDVIIAVEHCTDCEQHNKQSLRHDPAKYVKIANDVLFTLIKAVVDSKLAVRLYALRVKPLGGGKDRLGAMEITVAANITCPLLKRLASHEMSMNAGKAGVKAGSGAAITGGGNKLSISAALQRSSTQTAAAALRGEQTGHRQRNQSHHKQQHAGGGGFEGGVGVGGFGRGEGGGGGGAFGQGVRPGSGRQGSSRRTIAQSFDSYSSANKSKKDSDIAAAMSAAAAAAAGGMLHEEDEDDAEDGKEDDGGGRGTKHKKASALPVPKPTPPPGWATLQAYSKLSSKTWPNTKQLSGSVVGFLRAVLKEASLNYHSIAAKLEEEGIDGFDDEDEEDEDEQSGAVSSGGGSGSESDEDESEDRLDKKVGDYIHTKLNSDELEDIRVGYANWVARMKIPPRVERNPLDLDWPTDLVPEPPAPAPAPVPSAPAAGSGPSDGEAPGASAGGKVAKPAAAASVAPAVTKHPPGPMLQLDIAELVTRSQYEKLALEHFMVFDSRIKPPSLRHHHHHRRHGEQGNSASGYNLSAHNKSK